jgi:predicted RNase H-like HicB family nuclease
MRRPVRQRTLDDDNVEARPLMRNEFTAVFERDGDWIIAYCPEIPGANGQGRTKEEARTSLIDAITLILEDRREDGLRGVPPDAERETVTIR